MDKISAAKKIVTTIVGIGTTKIVHGIIENNVDTTTTISKVTVASASTVIGYSMSEKTSDYTDRKIDEAVTFWHDQIKPRLRKNSK